MTDIFQQRYFSINKFLFSLIGQWPYNSRRKRLTCLAVFVLIALSQIIPQIIAVVESSDDPEVIVESISPFVIDIVCSSKLANMVINSNKMLKLFQRIEVDWQRVAQQPEISVLCDYAETGRQFTIAYTVGIYGTMVVFLTQPMVPKILESIGSSNETHPIKYPFPVNYYGIDLETHYRYMLVHTSIAVGAIVTVIIVADTLFIIQMQHACGMFAVVGLQLKRMAKDVPEVKGNCPKREEDAGLRNLTMCIERHKDAIDFSDLLEATYTWNFFSLVGLNMVVMSITGFQTVLIADENPEEAVRYAMFTFAQMAHLFFQNFFSQRLMDHSMQVGYYLSQAEWYKTSLPTQKLVSFIALRTQVPCQLTAGKMLTMSLETFTAILKTSMSYFTLLRSTQ